nr:hypothetical protein [Sphingopyxis sp.]
MLVVANSAVAGRAGSALFSADEYLLATTQPMPQHVVRARGDFAEFETRAANAIANVAAIIAYVIELAEVQISPDGVGDCRVLVGFRPAFDNWEHTDQIAVGAKDAVNFGERFAVVNMLEDVIGDDEVDRIVGQINVLDVQPQIAVVAFIFRNLIARRQLRLNEPGNAEFARKMDDRPTGDFDVAALYCERKKSLALERPAFWTLNPRPQRHAKRAKLPFISASGANTGFRLLMRNCREPQLLKHLLGECRSSHGLERARVYLNFIS